LTVFINDYDDDAVIEALFGYPSDSLASCYSHVRFTYIDTRVPVACVVYIGLKNDRCLPWVLASWSCCVW